MPEIKLYNQDCMEALPSIEDNEFEMVITDPPYNVGYNYNEYNDNREDYRGWCEAWLKELERITTGFISISCGHKNLDMWCKIKKPTWVVCWYKPATMGRGAVGFNNWEPLIIYGKPFKQDVDVIKAPLKPNDDLDFHACPKPIKWATEQIKRYGCETGWVLDPFFGSGTVAIAAHRLGLNMVGFEVDKKYYDATKERVEREKAQTRMFNGR